MLISYHQKFTYKMQTIKHLCLALLFSVIGLNGAVASDHFKVLTEQAIAVKSPDHVVLISVTRAGSRLVAVGEHGVIIFSDDDGQTWRQALVPVSVVIVTVAFSNPNEGWAAGDYGVILHTDDGGATWQLQISGIQVNQLIMTAATRFAASDPANPASQRAVRRASFFMQDGPDKPFLTILPFGPQKVMVFGAYRMCVESDDRGKSWTDCSLDVLDPISHNLYDVIEAGSSIYIAGEVGNIFRSVDGGKTFLPVTEPAVNTLFGILNTNDSALIAFGVAGHMFRSTDHGTTWSPVKINAGANLTAGIILNSGHILIVSEAGDVFSSTDDGLTFHQTDENLGMGLYDLTLAENGDLIFVGTAGVRVLPVASFSQ